MKRLVQAFFNSLGLEIRRKKNAPPKASTMLSGFRRVSKLNIPVASVVDVGAAVGSWSVQASRTWPQAKYLLLEPLLERKQDLEHLVQRNTNFSFLPFAAGNKKTSVDFVVTDDLDGSGIASTKADRSRVRSVQVTRIDDAVRGAGLQGPYLIKLDTHGFEVPILEGCEHILDQVSLFIIECYGFQIADNSLFFWQMCERMDQLGFRLFDIVDIMHRPKDGAFWQCDAFFLRKEHSFFNDNRYQ